MIERLRAWTYRRQRLCDPARSVSEALRSVVAVYATHPTSPLALWARTGSFSPATYRRLDRDREAVRMPAMRRSVFLVPRASAARVFTATRATPAHALRPLKQHDLSIDGYERLARQILVAAGEPRSKRELEEAAGISGSPLGTVLRCLRYEGRLLTLAGESLNMAPHRYVDASAWVPEGLDAGDAHESLSWLAAEYLRGYGPARATDFAWWTGAAKMAARRAFETLDAVDVGAGLLILNEDHRAFEQVTPLRDELALLPRWDAYTMGHAPDGRARFVHPDVQAPVYTPIGTGLSGDGNPVVLVNGEAVATWTYSLKEGAAVQPFEPLGPRLRKRIDRKLEEIATLLAS